MKRLVMICTILVLASGCAVQKDMVPTGGSRSDGIVEISFEYGVYEKPQYDLEQGRRAAVQRCSAWGFMYAEPFGGYTEQCNNTSMGDCNRWIRTFKYQCLTDPPVDLIQPEPEVQDVDDHTS